MKILMVLEHEFPSDTRVENEIESLLQDGHEVHVACYTLKKAAKNGNYFETKIYRNPLSKFAHRTSVGALKFPFYFNIWRTFLDNIFRTLSFDAVHVHDLPLAKVGYEFAQKYNCKFVLDLHENWPALLDIAPHTKSLLGRFLSNTEKWKEYELKYCKLADNIIVVVDEAKERLVNLGIPSSKIVVVSNTLNARQFNLTDIEPDPNLTTLLYAGGVAKHRGLQYVIKGLKYLRKTDKPILVKIVGDGSYLSNLKALAKSEGVESMVEFTGWISHDEMFEFVGKSDICLIPHVKNNHTDTTIPHKLFQYMYASRPIIASNCLPIERIVLETKSGSIYKFDNPMEFASKVEQLIEDKELYNHMAMSGKKNVLKDYIWEIDGILLKEIYSG